MPLTKKGAKVKAEMAKTYGPKKGAQVFYATERSGKISGVIKDGARRSGGKEKKR